MNKTYNKEIYSLKVERTSFVFALLKSMVLIGVGVLAFICGLDFHYYGEWTTYEYYGGDAYSGIQNAAADTARNVDRLGDFIDDVAQSSYILIAIAFFAFGVLGLYKAIINIRHANEMIQRLNYFSNNAKESNAAPYDSTLEKVDN